MTKSICDRCGKDIGLFGYRLEITKGLLYSNKEFDLCNDCRKDLFDFMKWGRDKDLARIKPPTSGSNIVKSDGENK